MMAPKAHHIQRRLASPLTGLPSGTGRLKRTQDTWSAWITKHRAKQDRKGPTAHQGQGLIMARVQPNGSGDRVTAPPTDNRAGEQAYNHNTLMPLIFHKEAC